jgi:hypothetical protein
MVSSFSEKLCGDETYMEFYLVDSFEIYHLSGVFYDTEMKAFGSVVSNDGDIHIHKLTEAEIDILEESSEKWLDRLSKERPEMLADRIMNAEIE